MTQQQLNSNNTQQSTRELLSQLVDLVGDADLHATNEHVASKQEQAKDVEGMMAEKELLEAEVEEMKQLVAVVQGLQKQQEVSGKSQLHLFQSMRSMDYDSDSDEYDSEEEEEDDDNEEAENNDRPNLRASQQMDSIRANAVLLLDRADQLHSQVQSLRESKRVLKMQLVAKSRRFLQTEMSLVDQQEQGTNASALHAGGEDDTEEEEEFEIPPTTTNNNATNSSPMVATSTTAALGTPTESTPAPTVFVLPAATTTPAPAPAPAAAAAAAATTSSTAAVTPTVPTAYALPTSASQTTPTTNNGPITTTQNQETALVATAWVPTAEEQGKSSSKKTEEEGKALATKTNKAKQPTAPKVPAIPTTRNNAKLAKMKRRRVAVQRVSTITGGAVGLVFLGPLGAVLGAGLAHAGAKTTGRARERRQQRKIIKQQDEERLAKAEARATQKQSRLPVATPVFA